jgi:hypothetical protein
MKPFAVLAEMAKKEDWRGNVAEYRTWFMQNSSLNINDIRGLLFE